MLCCHALGLNRSWWTVTSQAATMCNFYASTSVQLLFPPFSPGTALMCRWEEYHTGTLYLSAFSGPVEGILMVVAIYAVTAIHPLGQAFWSQPIFSLIPGHYVMNFLGQVDKVLGLKSVLAGRGWAGLEGLPINVAFMMFGGAGTIGNIVNRSVDTSVAEAGMNANEVATTTSSRPTRRAARPSIRLCLATSRSSPTLVSSFFGCRASSEVGSGSYMMRGYSRSCCTGEWRKFLPCFVLTLRADRLRFSYQVSQLILAHVTKSPFPYWNGMMVYSIFGALDANSQWLFNR